MAEQFLHPIRCANCGTVGFEYPYCCDSPWADPEDGVLPPTAVDPPLPEPCPACRGRGNATGAGPGTGHEAEACHAGPYG